MPHIDQENKKRALISSRRNTSSKISEQSNHTKRSFASSLGNNYIVQKDWANKQFPMYKEMHIVIDVEIKTSSIFRV
jgi:hypothetical protein